MGSIRVDIFPGKWHLLSIPFTNPDGSGVTTVLDLFGDAALYPTSTRINFFDNATQGFNPVSEGRFFFGWNPGTLNLERRPFWLFVPDVGQPRPFSLYFTGNVPDGDQVPTVTQSIYSTGNGNNFISYNYPVVFDFLSSSLADAAQVGDSIVFWDPELGYTTTTGRFFFGWSPNLFNMIPGYAYFYRSSIDLTWQETKPYSWP